MKSILFFVVFAKTLFQGVLPEGTMYTSISGQGLEKETSNDCDVVIKEQFGHIRSPEFPGKYPRYSRCLYTVERFSENTCEVKLTIERFDVAKMTFSNCSADFFEIQNGNKRDKLCGEITGGSKKFVFFPDNSDRLVFKFQSTFHQKKGFSIEVKQLPFSCKKEINITTHATMTALPPCSQTISGRIGRITFPDLSDEEDLPIDKCTYTIRRSEARACVVQLDFSSFEVTESAGCETDYLQMPGGQRLCGILGGSRKLLQFPHGSDELVLEFVSSPDNSNSFDIQVAQLPGPCEYESAPNNTSPTGTYDNKLKGKNLSVTVLED